MKLLTLENPKLRKGEKKGYASAVLHLAPHKSSGVANVCPNASQACIALCLNGAGRGKFASVQDARARRTQYLKTDRPGFMRQLDGEIRAFAHSSERKGLTPCVRLNGTSDLPWHKLALASRETLLETFPELQFYDYTKVASRLLEPLPANYRLTFSRSETNEEACSPILAAGGNVAVVFNVKRGRDLPQTWQGFPVLDGDETDLRFLDPPGHVIGLRYKIIHKATIDFVESGFVVAP